MYFIYCTFLGVYSTPGFSHYILDGVKLIIEYHCHCYSYSIVSQEKKI